MLSYKNIMKYFMSYYTSLFSDTTKKFKFRLQILINKHKFTLYENILKKICIFFEKRPFVIIHHEKF